MEKHFQEENKLPLSKVANANLNTRRNTPPAKTESDKRKNLSMHSGEILDEIYSGLGGVQGSRMYWMNHEEQFRTMIESKFLTKQVFKEAATAQGEEIGKNIFMTFIQNNGLVQKETLPQVEATIVNPELEEKDE